MSNRPSDAKSSDDNTTWTLESLHSLVGRGAGRALELGGGAVASMGGVVRHGSEAASRLMTRGGEKIQTALLSDAAHGVAGATSLIGKGFGYVGESVGGAVSSGGKLLKRRYSGRSTGGQTLGDWKTNRVDAILGRVNVKVGPPPLSEQLEERRRHAKAEQQMIHENNRVTAKRLQRRLSTKANGEAVTPKIQGAVRAGKAAVQLGKTAAEQAREAAMKRAEQVREAAMKRAEQAREDAMKRAAHGAGAAQNVVRWGQK